MAAAVRSLNSSSRCKCKVVLGLNPSCARCNRCSSRLCSSNRCRCKRRPRSSPTRGRTRLTSKIPGPILENGGIPSLCRNNNMLPQWVVGKRHLALAVALLRLALVVQAPLPWVVARLLLAPTLIITLVARLPLLLEVAARKVRRPSSLSKTSRCASLVLESIGISLMRSVLVNSRHWPRLLRQSPSRQEEGVWQGKC